MKVAVIMGSKSDYPKLEDGINLLEEFGVEVAVRALSALISPAIPAAMGIIVLLRTTAMQRINTIPVRNKMSLKLLIVICRPFHSIFFLPIFGNQRVQTEIYTL